MTRLTVAQHSRLERRGGMARVAGLLCAELPALGAECRQSFEVAETRAGEDRLALVSWPVALAGAAADGAVLHLHGSEDWPALLESLPAPAAGGPFPPVITLHDMQLLTGGCVYAAGCPRDPDEGGREAHAQPCPALRHGPDCPRNHQDSAARRERIAAQLARLRPLVAAPSVWMRRQASIWLPGLECRVIPNGVEWPDAPPDRQAARRRLGLAEDARLAVFCAHGGLEAAWKAGGSWLALWERIKALEPRAVACMVGGQAQERRGDLFLWPYVDREAMALFLAASDVLVYPTLADNHPLVVLEAMAAGSCVAASSVGGIPEQVRHGETGVLVQGGPAVALEDLAAAAARLLARPRQARTLGAAAFERGKAAFCARRMAGDYLGLYRQAAGYGEGR